MDGKFDKVAVYERAVELLEEQGSDSYLHENYFGRGMYGRSVPGIVSSACGPLVGHFIVAAAIDIVRTTTLKLS